MLKKRMALLCFLITTGVSAQNLKKILIKAYTSTDSSDYYFKEAKKFIKTEADEGEFYFCKNARHVDFGNPDSAVFYGKKAIEKLSKTNSSASLYTVYNNINKVYKKQGQYDKGLHYLFEGLKLAEKESASKWVRFFYTQLSLNYHDFEHYNRGVYYGKKAVDQFLKEAKPDPSSLYLALNALAINYDDWNKPNEALYYHKMVLKYVKGKDTLGLASTYNNIGNTLLKQKKFKEAESWIKRAIVVTDLTKEGNEAYYDYEHATHYTNLGTIASELGDYEKAEKMFAKAHYYARKSQNAEKLRDYYYQSFQFNKKRKNLQKTVEDQDLYIKLRDSVYKEERAKTVAEAEAKYQNEKKEKQLLLAKNKLITEQIENKEKTNWLIIISLLTVSAVIAGGFFIRQQKMKNRQQEQEFELKNAISVVETQNKLQEQRLGISRDLHDNIGAQLTFIISSIDNLKYGFTIEDEKLKEKLSGINMFTRNTIAELRDTIWAMNKDEITFLDLKARIANFIDSAKTAFHNVQFNFEIDNAVADDVTFTSLEGINIYRVIQESLNNSMKYAQASVIEVKIQKEEAKISVTITDNGKGFNTNETALGNGLNNMAKRMAEVGGQIRITSEINRGTTVKVVL
ncbi:tetratricopeptide repeat-containing sensor histidine kinase [Flavobacterium pedocola]